MIGMIYSVGVETGIFPLLIFMGVGALTDFGALIAGHRRCCSAPRRSSASSRR
jgi:Na+-transporting methylmalonyl-CoA/oxaloacetate decarboxylase beta subunit